MSYQDHVFAYFLYILGDGAGGNLAAAVSLKLRDEKWSPTLKMQVRSPH